MVWGWIANLGIGAIGTVVGMKWFESNKQDPDSISAAIGERADHPEILLKDAGDVVDYVSNTGEGGAIDDAGKAWQRAQKAHEETGSYASAASAIINADEGNDALQGAGDGLTAEQRAAAAAQKQQDQATAPLASASGAAAAAGTTPTGGSPSSPTTAFGGSATPANPQDIDDFEKKYDWLSIQAVSLAYSIGGTWLAGLIARWFVVDNVKEATQLANAFERAADPTGEQEEPGLVTSLTRSLVPDWAEDFIPG